MDSMGKVGKSSVYDPEKNKDIPYSWPQNLNKLGDLYLQKHGFEKQVDKLLEESIELAHAIIEYKKYGGSNTSRFKALLKEAFDVNFLIEHQIFRYTDHFLLEDVYKEKIEQLKKGI